MKKTPQITIGPGDPKSPDAVALLEASHVLMRSNCPPESNHFLSIDALCGDEIRFFLASATEKATGCCALAVREGYGELKSMYVDPNYRAMGIGEALIVRIEREAKSEGLGIMRLETGCNLFAAQRLYERVGYARRGSFGNYRADPLSIFMEKVI